MTGSVEGAGRRWPAVAGVAVVAGLALAWFFVSWTVLDSPLVDAIGETLGGLMLLLVVISIVGAARRTRE